ncbi:hypothetical protein GXP70_06725 [Paenibacillus lycopersici]|uniref:Uncharacterized protein n=1 Tax=Paenibacillus lycopersici TaxID=2704462 RepID=A0A6C0G4A9_9BACL|nr:hypothetical protein [Paenibacillus lycopersici]QHT59675.1 hypothetical protein GXP70_06725 [Paenibacillus lycopersici]
MFTVIGCYKLELGVHSTLRLFSIPLHSGMAKRFPVGSVVHGGLGTTALPALDHFSGRIGIGEKGNLNHKIAVRDRTSAAAAAYSGPAAVALQNGEKSKSCYTSNFIRVRPAKMPVKLLFEQLFLPLTGKKAGKVAVRATFPASDQQKCR